MTTIQFDVLMCSLTILAGLAVICICMLLSLLERMEIHQNRTQDTFMQNVILGMKLDTIQRMIDPTGEKLKAIDVEDAIRKSGKP